MPRAPKACSHPSGCTKTDGGDGSGRCADHKRPAWQGSQRGKATGSAEWKRLRLKILARDGWRCQLNYPGICLIAATQVDHIEGVAAGGNDDEDNLWGVCVPCHRRKTGGEGGSARRGPTKPPPPPAPRRQPKPERTKRALPRTIALKY
jgi:5-methylcytosine-specific restriction enzyme A